MEKFSELVKQKSDGKITVRLFGGGALATPIPFPEVYTALDQKAVDGATYPLVTIPVMKFNEVQKYLSLTRHMYNSQIILIGKKTWDKLSNDEKKIIQDAANEAGTISVRCPGRRMRRRLRL
jgi:TRAP-type C4-dicarboxylate transport system substrate-binding protein